MHWFETRPTSKPSYSFKAGWTVLKPAGQFWSPQTSTHSFKVVQGLSCSLSDHFKAVCFDGMNQRALKASIHHNLTALLKPSLLIVALSMESLLIVRKYTKTILCAKFPVYGQDGLSLRMVQTGLLSRHNEAEKKKGPVQPFVHMHNWGGIPPLSQIIDNTSNNAWHKNVTLQYFFPTYHWCKYVIRCRKPRLLS